MKEKTVKSKVTEATISMAKFFVTNKFTIKMTRVATFLAVRAFVLRREINESIGYKSRRDSLTEKIDGLTLLAKLGDHPNSGLHIYSVRNSNMIFIMDLEQGNHAFMAFSFDTDEEIMFEITIEDALPLLKEDVAMSFLLNLDIFLDKNNGRI